MKEGSIFFTVLLAIFVVLFLFAPERFPSGIGFSRVPIEASARESMVGLGRVVELTNPADKIIHKVKITLFDVNNEVINDALKEKWAPGDSHVFGWIGGWKIEKGYKLKVKAAGYLSRTWQY